MYLIALMLAIVGQAAPLPRQGEDAGSYLMGKPDSPMHLEMFSDFQCPSCRSFYLDTVTSLLKEYSAGNKVAFIFREFPLAQHPVARTAARYSEAAKVLGFEKWLRVIEYLYFCQAEWSYDGKIERVLSRILTPDEMQTLNRRLSDPKIEQAIDQEVALGKTKDVVSTPTVFVSFGGKQERFVGGLPFVVLKDYINQRLQ